MNRKDKKNKPEITTNPGTIPLLVFIQKCDSDRQLLYKIITETVESLFGIVLKLDWKMIKGLLCFDFLSIFHKKLKRNWQRWWRCDSVISCSKLKKKLLRGKKSYKLFQRLFFLRKAVSIFFRFKRYLKVFSIHIWNTETWNISGYCKVFNFHLFKIL